MRNSSLVKRLCADNVTGLKHITEAEGQRDGFDRLVGGRGAFCTRRSDTGRSRGLYRSENAGMSSEKYVRTIFTESPRFPTEGQSASG